MRLSPVNLVSRWYWTSGDSQEPLPREILQRALMKNGHYRPEVLAALDTNHDGRLDRRELRLDSESKRKTVEQLLMAAGVKNPMIRAEVKIHQISHGVTEPEPGTVRLCGLSWAQFPDQGQRPAGFLDSGRHAADLERPGRGLRSHCHRSQAGKWSGNRHPRDSKTSTFSV